MESFSKISTSEEETRRLGSEFGAALGEGSIVALVGDLGAGKTQFVKGIATAHGIDPTSVSSPTFTIAHEYSAAIPIYHLDLYRLKGPEEVVRSGVEDYFDRGGICLIERPEKAEHLLPASTILIRIQHLGEDKRRIECFSSLER